MRRIALVPYTRGWSYDLTARALEQHLAGRFEIRILYAEQIDEIARAAPDLIVDFSWSGRLHRCFPGRVVKQVSSHRWARAQHNSLDAAALAARYMHGLNAAIVPSRRLYDLIAATGQRAELGPKGFHPETFGDRGRRAGEIAIGWAGNADAPDKNVALLLEAWPSLRIADRCLTQGEMPAFYNAVDVIAVASDAEGDPRPLIEAMACGCFPIVVDVGIVPELVRNGENGLVVERSAEAFRAAFAWCAANLDRVRAAGRRNAIEMRATRSWARCATAWGDAFDRAIDRAPPWTVNERTVRLFQMLAAARRRGRGIGATT